MQRIPGRGAPASAWSKRRDWLAAGGVALTALLVYLPFRSLSLDDFDSFNFARALSEFNPARFQPHPPGYVLYVLLGRIALALAGNPTLALTTLSAIGAAVACELLYATATLLFDRRSALIAVLLVIATPLMWLNADKALSDAPGLCAQALGGLLLALAWRRPTARRLAIAAGWVGVAAGFRPQAVLGLAAAWLVVALWTRTPLRAWALAVPAALAGALTWLLPTLSAFGWNIAALSGYMTGATGFVAGQESLFATTLTLQSLGARLAAVWDWSSQAIFGPLPAPLRAILALGALAAAILPFLTRARQTGTKPVAWVICAAWLLPQAVLQVLFLNPELTRYLLACLFPAALLIAAGLAQLGAGAGRAATLHRTAPPAVALAFCALTGAAALPLAQTLHTVPAPPDQLAAYLARRLPRDGAFILARQSYNALAYELPGWTVRFADAYAPEALPHLLADSRATYIVIADPEGIQPGEEYVQIDSVHFARDPQVHAKHASVDANIYGLTAALGPAEFALPPDGIIRTGAPQDGKYLLQGWYRVEDIGGIPARWTGSAGSAALRVMLPQRDITLTLTILSYVPNQVISLRCDDQLLQRMPVYQQWAQVSFQLPAECAHADRPTRLDIQPALRRAPPDDGGSTDRRPLAIAVARIQIK
ncbi:MAG: glycosyltransferase family 39 protein [Chloroflexi bacterium]|nr:glycosyltransferase family 39 protein [Chloroflexota bacterium]